MRVIERALVDYFRCPERFVKMSLASELSAEEGFFRFGAHICYGQSSRGSRSPVLVKDLYDTAPAVTAEAGLLPVTFRPPHGVAKLRLERYNGGNPRAAARRPTALPRRYYS